MVPATTRMRLRLTPRLRDGVIVLTCLIAQAAYLLYSRLSLHQSGFPLDDAWIYQVYARNLAQTGQWAFVPGAPSSGSTSVLWTLLIAPAYLLRIDPQVWTQLAGLMMLIATALGAARLFEADDLSTSLAVGLAVALEWHLVWAAASGMETMCFAALLVWFWLWVRRRDPTLHGHLWRDGLLLGLWGGVLLLARPEGTLAAGVAGVYGLLAHGTPRSKVIWALAAGLGIAILLLPFFYLNISASGSLWPNTFYAKQSEYAVLWSIPYPARLVSQLVQGWLGAQVLLLPAVVADWWSRLRRKPIDRISLLPWVWVIAHGALYAARLPVVYQHGRYAIPVIPIILIHGVRGALSLARPVSHRRIARLVSLAWLLALAMLFPLVFVTLGAPAYSRDVAFIEIEMGAAARWVQNNTQSTDVIAIHDIGELGFGAPRPIVDLAGLVSPAVIPFMNDDQRLAAYIRERRAAYLVVFPRWSPAYERLVSSPGFCKAWSADENPGYVAYAPDLGPLTVYRVLRGQTCP